MKSSNYRGKLYQGTAEICSNYRKFELWRVELRRFFIKGLYRNFEGTEESSSNYRKFELGRVELWRFDCNTSLSSIRKTCLRKVISGDPWDFSCFQIRIRICTIMLNKKLVRSDYPSFPTNVHSEGSSEK